MAHEEGTPVVTKIGASQDVGDFVPDTGPSIPRLLRLPPTKVRTFQFRSLISVLYHRATHEAGSRFS